MQYTVLSGTLIMAAEQVHGLVFSTGAYAHPSSSHMPPETTALALQLELEARSVMLAEPALLLPLEHMPDVGRFLPELATELATAQTTQDEEVEQKEQHLHHLKEELKKEKEQLSSVVASVCAANSAITIARDRAAQASLGCRQLEKSIATLVAEREWVRGELERVVLQREWEEGRREEYGKKMAGQRAKVARVEQDSAVHRELVELQAKIQALRDKRASYMHGAGLEILRGELQNKLQDQILAAVTTGDSLDKDMAQIKQKVQLGEQRVLRRRKEGEVTKKRRQAQLTRLHRQLQEAQVRGRQWARQTELVRSSVSQLRHKLTQ